MRARCSVLLLLLALPAGLAAECITEPLDLQFAAGDLAGLLAAQRSLASGALDEEGEFLVAFADYRIARLWIAKGDEAKAMSHLTAAAARLKDLVRRYETSETHALLAAVYGLQIGLKPAKAVLLTRRAEKAVNAARHLDPLNPRVDIVAGIAKLNRPGVLGGGAGKAITDFEAAVARFEQTRRGDRRICWGRPEAYIWAGIAREQVGDREAADAYYRKAVEMRPGHIWARLRLQH